ncbi:DNA cytosine methyltransferase [Bosea sp. BK604]|uniref:DNA cytosine methyltransferase n=1 Tax=Bosea sp. BK604 TaxID=2512180 RepID=UPI001049777B|nr:DNA cytosine methyltransferase [Bosea sp. BK604]TCR69709.1 DNA (cytosine-5)-methyltransferase 1 [Bosea sp. BK604]
MIRYLSVCSGIEAFTVATEGLGFAAAAFSEIDRFASAVLAERFGSNMPGEPLPKNAPPNIGDFTRLLDDADLRASLGRIDLLVGGTPCQAFSFAGKRLSLADARGNLTLAFAVLAHELVRHGLRNAVWENVPGVLSTPDNAFGCFLGALVGADAPLDLPRGIGRWPDAGMVSGPRARAAWRVLDAQYFGLAQRRERVLLVVDLGGGADPASVLFEPQSLQGNSPPRREKGERAAGATQGGAGSRGRPPGGGNAFGGNNCAGPIEVATAVNAHGGPMGRMDFESETFIAEVAQPLGAKCGGGWRNDLDNDTYVAEIAAVLDANFGRLQGASGQDANHGHSHLVAFDTTQITSAANCSNPQPGDPGHPLAASAHPPALAYRVSGNHGAWETGDKVDALTTGTDRTAHLVAFSIMPQNSGRDYKAREVDIAQPLMAGGPVGGNQGGDYVLQNWAVRRLTPAECARLQGFPDHHSRIAWRGKPAEQCPDGPQYKTYGNSMATKKMRWLAERLAAALASATL